MAVSLHEESGGKVLRVEVNGKLSKEDYEQFVPAVENLIQQHGKIRVLFEMYDFHGWDLGALWEDIKFDVRHFRDIERLAMVGEAYWQKNMAQFCVPFTTAHIRYFDHGRAPAAREWIAEDL